ncbi:hypothetical protein [Opitutus sp. ER46]|uniref:hypothetical protein n=1 Tax=Opitutus sp. ER46 TaxID=2161864 RepID=UPI000D31BE84|nr:hypothetical protein [Opitutus sp. ER46]PTX98634.1 hypothetical protein DB354_05060 [Opitutus sp. ER46]
MKSALRFLALIPCVLALLACTTTSPRKQDGDDIIGANAVYRARVENDHGRVRYVITEVWRHDPVLGAMPQPGEVFRLTGEWYPGRGEISLIVIGPHERLGRVTRTLPIINSRVGPKQLPEKWLHDKVLAGTAAAPLPEKNAMMMTLEECALRASGVYLTRVDTSGSQTRFIVTEVWRHVGPDLPPEVGTDVVSPHPRDAKNAAMRISDLAVVFILPNTAGLAGAKHSAFFVNHGMVGGMPMQDLKDLVSL